MIILAYLGTSFRRPSVLDATASSLFHGDKIQYFYSFSTTDTTSGINNDATAYVGCLLNKVSDVHKHLRAPVTLSY